MFRRVVDFFLTTARQAVPVGGIFALGWQPAVAVAVYWIESVLLVAIAVALCVRLRASTSVTTVEKARAAGVHPGDVMVFHWGSMALFGGFFALILFILTMNGRIEPIDWAQLQYAAGSMAVVLAFGFAIDSLMTPNPSLAVVRARVDACLGRWALMWLLGFGGTMAMMFTGRPAVFFQVFAALKVTWEVWGLLARTFGWTSLQDRAQTGRG